MERESHLTSPVDGIERESCLSEQSRVSSFIRSKLAIALIGIFSLTGGCAATSSIVNSNITPDRSPAEVALGKGGNKEDGKNNRPLKPKGKQKKKNKPLKNKGNRMERYLKKPFSIERCLWWSYCHLADSRDSYPSNMG